MTSSGAPSYRFVKELAQGGMGSIELVVRREGAFARPYARKRLLKQFADDIEVRAMFLEEARVAGLVRHANVVGVLDVGEDEDGPFLVMDLVDGVPLLDVLRSFRDQLPVQVAVEIARQVAEGLDAAHELVAPDGRPMELVHRDVSLTNVLVGFDGVVRVVDFGVARAVDRGSLTRIGTLKGRVAYMSAEQLQHQQLDRRADLFALGVVLTELLRGSRLHGNTPAEQIVRKTLEEPPPDIGELRDDLPPALEELLFELMARDREARPKTARAVAQRLLAIATELRAEEGPIDLGELMRLRFEAVREKHAELLRFALGDRAGTEIEPALEAPVELGTAARLPGLHDVATELHSRAAAPVVTLIDRPEKASVGPRIILGSLAALALALVVWVAGGRSAPLAGDPVPTSTAPSRSPSEGEPMTEVSPPALPGLPVAPSAPVAAEPEAAVLPSSDGPPAEPPEETIEEVEPGEPPASAGSETTPVDPPDRRPRRRVRRTGTADRTGVSTWDWE